MANDDSDPQKTPPLALPAELDIDNDNTDVMCIRCGRRMTCTVCEACADVMCIRCGRWMTCTVCEACDLHCLERDAVKCALLVVEATRYLRNERSHCAVRQLAWALQVQKGMTAAAAAAAAHKLVHD
jgi:hypothetical protein